MSPRVAPPQIQLVILAFFFFFCSTSLVSGQSKSTFNVIDFGAVGDGKTDDSQAFTKAWNATCSAAGDTPTLLLPQGKTFLLKPITFKGPCKSPSIHIQVSGDVAGPSTIPEWNKAPAWLDFHYVDNLTINGTGRIGGQGSIWWPCKTNRKLAMSFAFCNGLVLSGFHLFDNPKNHIHTLQCNGAVISHLTITAPEDSPNTDGINLAESTGVQIYNCTIGTGDDCISFLNGTSNINISYITCGPGHGISIGSLGWDGTVGIVEKIHVSHSSFFGTLTGARIKTWQVTEVLLCGFYLHIHTYICIPNCNLPYFLAIDKDFFISICEQGGSGYVREISFKDIVLDKVKIPIDIDQFYPNSNSIKEDGQSIQVSNVSFIGVHGTATLPTAIVLKCTGPEGCTNITLNDVNITSADPGNKVGAYCQNVHGTCSNCIPKVPCLG
ncbi:putative polygalacturonase [Cinnamomum micranthum f. kanehirae]|uniref:Putative polygalacturonase n=1 Tax=Cinnamomum micranthum f. kanehirae TaxID=337451 RepID=A0A3S3N0L2_9MAGN|nr:putative polygalacturonase [Cinnamomum micranthum f. kanehirae]